MKKIKYDKEACCLSDKAVSYIKSKPAICGKPMKFEDQVGTSSGITQADVIKARTEGYNAKMYKNK